MTLVPTEASEQAALFQWAEYAVGTYPELRLLHAIPNGGLRDGRTAAMLQRTGVKPGVPDVCLPVARGDYHGLYIEMKRQKGGTVSASQKVWLERLKRQRYKAVVCKGWEQARGTIIQYLEGK